MFRKSMKRILATALACSMVLGCVPSTAFAANTVATQTVSEPAAQAELAVTFDQEYAAAGQELSVTVTGGSDVTYAWYVGGQQIANTTNSWTPTEADVENWIEVRVTSGSATASTKMYYSNLPVVYIDTEGGQAITSKVDYIDANLRIQGNEEYNSETTKLYDGLTEIRGRGNSTWSQPKKPYRLKLDKKTDLFGMGKSKHWVLLANYLDESLMRNTMAYNLSGSMGMEYMSTVWVNVVLNGDFVGNYQLCENIRVDDTRVDIFDWEGFAEDSGETIGKAVFGKSDEDSIDALMAYMCEEDMSWITSGVVNYNGASYNIADYGIEVPDINGGYILELDEYWDEASKFKTASGQPIQFKNPEFVGTNADMMAFVQNYVQAFEDAVQEEDYSTVYNGEETHYSELYDMDALVDYWLICEIFFQEEINKKSTYMYKDIDGLMMMGPIWDMDWSSGGEGSVQSTSNWATLYFSANAQANQWYKYLVQDPYFFVKAQERYWEIRYAQLQDMLDQMPVDYEYLKESGAANSARWPQRQSFESDYANLYNWMNNHVAWLDEQMGTENTLASSFYSADSNIQLTLADVDGNELKGDLALKAAADYSVTPDTDVVLTVSGINGTADVYVNSMKLGQIRSGEDLTIPASALTAATGEKDVIEVKSGTSSNYVTVKEKESGTDSGIDKSELENLIYEAAEKQVSNYSPASWAVFQEAYTNAYATALDAAATAEEVEEARVALEAAMAALVEVRDPADASDDYEVSKITYSAGSAQDGEGIELAFDGDENTFWHTQYNSKPDWYGTEAALDHFWVLFELEDIEMIEALRYLPRNNNGDIKSYRIEGSLDGENWETLAEGDWEYSSVTWQSAEFDATEVKYIRLWATATQSSSGNNRHVSARELRLRVADEEVTPLPTPEPTPEPTPTPVPVSEVIPVSEMTATAGDSQSGEGPEMAIDENESTTWHTDWYAGDNHDNHWIQFELSSNYRVDSLRYLPRQSQTNGIITQYEVLVSLDGETWEKVAEGSWAADAQWKEATFDAVEAKYVRLQTIEAESDQALKFASAAEIRLTGTKAIDCQEHTTERRNATAATCTEDGYTGDLVCTNCGAVVERGKTIEKLGHKWSDWVTTEATCTEDGSKVRMCAVCEEQEKETIPAEGHDWGEWEVVKEATETEKGLKERECTICKEKETEEIPALGTPEPTPTPTPDPWVNPFTDVSETKWYYNAVAWGSQNDVVVGMSEDKFAPLSNCTRAQIVSFLWRAEGRPEPASEECKFTDVSSSKWYYKAVLWATENGYVAGYTDTTFAPDATCKRAEMATFLWRMAGKEAPESSENPFIDVAAGKWYETSAQWAYENGIVSGYDLEEGKAFAPDNQIARAETVTMLYRYYN